jgi:hypothetical protein
MAADSSKAIEGKLTLDSFFNVSRNGPEDAKIEFLPNENGVFEIAVYLMNPDEWGYIDYLPVEEVAKAAANDFEAFAAAYPKVGTEWEELRDLSIYSIWLHRESPNDREIIPTMKGDLIYSNCVKAGWANTYEQPLHAMAMKDTEKAAKLIIDTYLHMTNSMLPVTVSTFKTHYQACPPTFGVAVVDLLGKTGSTLPAEDAAKLYSAMTENFAWWHKGHSFAAHRFSYNHRDEMQLAGTSYSAFEFPLETPDLYALMILYTEAIAKLSAIVGDGKAAEWTAEQKAITEELLSLWNGTSFDCRAAVSSKRFATESLLAYLPVILGGRLPADVIDKLTAALGDEEKFLSDRGFRSESRQSAYYDADVTGCGAVVAWLQQLIIGSLFNCGKTDLAEKAAVRFLEYAKDNGAKIV